MAEARPASDDLQCFANGGYGFDLRLMFADDTAVSLRGNTGGCGLVEAADGWHVGADEILETFVAQDIVGWTRWGDTVVLSGICRQFVISPIRTSAAVASPDVMVDPSGWRPPAGSARDG